MDKIAYTCIAIDDEEPALEKIRNFCHKIPFLELRASFTNGLDGLAWIKKNKADILFLDVQMDELTGLQLIDFLHEKPQIILSTAYEQYAIKGYELNVTDYLLKPYSFERFLKAVNKAILNIDEHRIVPLNAEKAAEPSKDYIFVKTEYRIQKIFVSDILYIEGMKDYLRIVCSNERIMTLMSFAGMLEMLAGCNFIRVHKSYIVALDKIESIERDRIIIAKERIPIGETYRSSFFKLIQPKRE